MSLSGTYAIIDGKLQRINADVPSLARPVHFNKGGLRYFDKSARREFHTKHEKRSWLKQHGMREGGIINPDKAPD